MTARRPFEDLRSHPSSHIALPSSVHLITSPAAHALIHLRLASYRQPPSGLGHRSILRHTIIPEPSEFGSGPLAAGARSHNRLVASLHLFVEYDLTRCLGYRCQPLRRSRPLFRATPPLLSSITDSPTALIRSRSPYLPALSIFDLYSTHVVTNVNINPTMLLPRT